MALRATKLAVHAWVWVVICGTGIIGYVSWQSDQYRAATPLVFIFGFVLLFFMLFKQLRSLVDGAFSKSVSAARTQTIAERRLWRLHVPQLITNLYFTHIAQYPEWIHESRDYVPSSVTTAGRTTDGKVVILLNYSEYEFLFTSFPVGEGEQQQGVLTIFREKEQVFLLRVLRAVTKKGVVYWVPTAIEAFSLNIGWIRDFENLKAEILAIIKNRAREARES